MRTTAVAATLAAIFSFQAQSCDAQSSNIQVFVDPVLIKDLYNVFLVNAIKAAMSNQPFVLTSKPGNGILMITETDKPKFREGKFEFSVSFFRNGSHLADSIETCTSQTVSDCADQLASDAKDASAIGD